MAHLSRLYLLGPSGHRQFYWVQLDDDHSLYIGSSNAKLFSYGYGGVARASTPAQPVVPTRDGRALTRIEIEGRISLHGSGVVNLTTVTSGKRDRVHIVPPRAGIDALPLAALIPMEPSRYPVSKKAIKPTDLCIPEQLEPRVPIALLIYVASRDSAGPMPVSVARQRIQLVQELSRPLGNLSLRLLIYSDPNLPQWPKEEVQVIAHPESPGGRPKWPFFV